MNNLKDDEMIQQESFPKKVLLAITGSIAAYKAADLTWLLKKAGVEVRVVLTEGGSSFITPMTLQALSGHLVYQTLMDVEHEAAISHINLARWADLILIMPCTAHMIAKLAAGFADDLLSTLCLATDVPIVIVPAMNTKMWRNPATQANIACLRSRKTKILGPAMGLQACGEMGEGCVLEPEEVLSALKDLFETKAGQLKKEKVLITAGPTREALDPVRYLSNYSSGKMGYAVAKAAQEEGAQVTLISGPTLLDTPSGVKKIDIISGQEMFDAVMSCIHEYSIFIATAAVADYRVKTKSEQKIKKTADHLQLELIPNPDILASVAGLPHRPFIIGFAAETENLIENAQAKLKNKKADMIVANLVGENRGFQSDYNELTVITQNTTHHLAYDTKEEIAKNLIQFVSELKLAGLEGLEPPTNGFG